LSDYKDGKDDKNVTEKLIETIIVILIVATAVATIPR
jgi:hypothetical protein